MVSQYYLYTHNHNITFLVPVNLLSPLTKLDLTLEQVVIDAPSLSLQGQPEGHTTYKDHPSKYYKYDMAIIQEYIT